MIYQVGIRDVRFRFFYNALWFWAFYRNSEFLRLIMRLKRFAMGVSVMGPRRWQLLTDAPCHSRCGMFKNPHCSMAMSSEHRSKFPALHQQWLRLHWMNNSPAGQKKQTNNKQLLNVLHLKTFECLLAVAILKHFVLPWKDNYRSTDFKRNQLNITTGFWCFINNQG